MKPLAYFTTLIAALAGVYPAHAQPAVPDKLAQAVLAAEDRAFQAEINADANAIKASFAEEGTFTHANGTVQSRQEFIGDILDGHLAFRSIVPVHRTVWAAGTVGVTHADMNLVVGQKHLSGSYTAVYQLRDGRWQLVDWQSSGAPHPG